MEITISKTYSETISRDYQTWKYNTTLTKKIEVASAEELKAENEKLWKQVKHLTCDDIERDESYRTKRLDDLRNG